MIKFTIAYQDYVFSSYCQSILYYFSRKKQRNSPVFVLPKFLHHVKAFQRQSHRYIKYSLVY